MFEIGDMVQIKPINLMEKRNPSYDDWSDILFRSTKSDLSFVKDMLVEQLHIATIRDIRYTSTDTRIRVDNWWYDEDWIELVKKG